MPGQGGDHSSPYEEQSRAISVYKKGKGHDFANICSRLILSFAFKT